MASTRVSIIPGVLVAVAALLAVPGAAAAGGGLPVPSASFGAGVTGPPETAAGAVRFSTISGRRETTVVSTEVSGGEIRSTRSFPGRWALPAVTFGGEAGGLSADARTLVLLRPSFRLRPKATRFVVLDAKRLRVRKRVAMDGLASFDAISPDGRLLYLIDYASPDDPLDYEVRAYDLDRDELLPEPIVDPAEPDEQMSGQPISRAMSPDGRWAYTLYGGGKHPFVHALDTEGATAVCVDLHHLKGTNEFRVDLDVNPVSGAISLLYTSKGLGDEPVATIDPSSFEVFPISDVSASASSSDGSPAARPFLAAIGAVALGVIALVAARRRQRRKAAAELDRIFAAPQAEQREREPVA